MATKVTTLPKLKKWAEKYQKTVADSNDTRSCIISLKDIRKALVFADERSNGQVKVDGFRIYFTREEHFVSNPRLKVKDPVSGKLVAQLNVALVPTYGYKKYWDEPNGKFFAGAKNFADSKGAMIAIIPGQKGSEHSGLCPPNCGGH